MTEQSLFKAKDLDYKDDVSLWYHARWIVLGACIGILLVTIFILLFVKPSAYYEWKM